MTRWLTLHFLGEACCHHVNKQVSKLLSIQINAPVTTSCVRASVEQRHNAVARLEIYLLSKGKKTPTISNVVLVNNRQLEFNEAWYCIVG